MRDVDIRNIGIARQSNPSAKLDGEESSMLMDDLGRPITRHYVRDLVYTAQASLTTGTAATLLTGTANFYADLVQLTAANNSTAAATVAVLDEGTTVRTLVIPAGSTVSFSFTPALKQSATGGNWSVDMEDITGTTVSVAAEFHREV